MSSIVYKIYNKKEKYYCYGERVYIDLKSARCYITQMFKNYWIKKDHSIDNYEVHEMEIKPTGKILPPRRI